MNTYSIISSLTIIACFITMGITGLYADTESISTEGMNVSDGNLTKFETGMNDVESGNMTPNLTVKHGSGEVSQGPEEPPVIFNGTTHPNEETDVKSSTPSGNPLIPKFAQGGVNIDIGAHLMEGRGTENNASSVVSLRDHTSAFGYIRTIQKDFHYMGGENPT